MTWLTQHKKQNVTLALSIDQAQVTLLLLDERHKILYARTEGLPTHVIKDHEILDILALSQLIKAVQAPAFEKKSHHGYRYCTDHPSIY